MASTPVIKLGGRTFHIVDTPRDKDTTEQDVGMIDYDREYIYINPEMESTSSWNITLLHEILHYVFYVCARNDLRNDEELVSAMSEILYQIIKENNKRMSFK